MVRSTAGPDKSPLSYCLVKARSLIVKTPTRSATPSFGGGTGTNKSECEAFAACVVSLLLGSGLGQIREVEAGTPMKSTSWQQTSDKSEVCALVSGPSIGFGSTVGDVALIIVSVGLVDLSMRCLSSSLS